MSYRTSQKPATTPRKTPLIIIGIIVCFMSMLTINGMTSLQKANRLLKNIQHNSRLDVTNQPGGSTQMHEKPSKPHYDFLSYYFMVESDREKSHENDFQKDHDIARRFAMLPKLLFNSLFDQN